MTTPQSGRLGGPAPDVPSPSGQPVSAGPAQPDESTATGGGVHQGTTEGVQRGNGEGEREQPGLPEAGQRGNPEGEQPGLPEAGKRGPPWDDQPGPPQVEQPGPTEGDERPRSPRRGGVAVPSILSGVGLALSLPPWGFWILAFPAAGLLWWRLEGLRPRARLWSGWLAGLGCFVPGLMWARSFTLAGAIALIVIEALFPAVACLAVPPRFIGARALAFPAAMTLAEAARMSWPFGGLPMGGVFLGQAGGPVLGAARLGGPLLLTAAVFTGGVAVAGLVQAALRGYASVDGARGPRSGGLRCPRRGGRRHHRRRPCPRRRSIPRARLPRRRSKEVGSAGSGSLR